MGIKIFHCLARLGARVTGVDACKENIDIAQESLSSCHNDDNHYWILVIIFHNNFISARSLNSNKKRYI